MKYTATIKKTNDGRLIARCEEFPNAQAEGLTISEVLNNLTDVIKDLKSKN